MQIQRKTADKFTLNIELGNAAMQTTYDVAQALRKLAEYVEGVGEWGSDEAGGLIWHLDAGSIRDENGNTVGGWELVY